MEIMKFTSFPLLSLHTAFTAGASLLHSPSLFPRHATGRPINATITDHTGVDITSSFKIMVYHEPEKPAPANNLTDRRRQDASLSRPIMDCHIPGAVFLDSFCTYEGGKPSGMQGWEISCYYFYMETGKYRMSSRLLKRRSGHCRNDEICVDGLGPGGKSRHGEHSVASCVSTLYFTRMVSNVGKPAGEREPLLDLKGRQATMVVSKVDGSTPIEVDTLNIQAVDASGHPVQKRKCRDCTDLKSSTFGPKTNGLRAEATLLTTGAIAGILWLAILSG